MRKDPFNATDMKKIWSYEKLKDGSIRITRYKGESFEVEIPPRIGKSPVTSIGDNAFYGCSSLTNITITDSVTSIGSEAFYGCTNLIIHTSSGSYAETYAQKKKIPVKIV